MKITKTRLKQIIKEELKEVYADRDSLRKRHGYDAPPPKPQSREPLKKFGDNEIDFGDDSEDSGLELAREGEDDYFNDPRHDPDHPDHLDRPSSRREHLGDAVHDVMEGALREYLAEMGFDPKKIDYIIRRDVEESILKAAVRVSEVVGRMKKFDYREMNEAKKKSKRK